jgi:hypothetical protein
MSEYKGVDAALRAYRDGLDGGRPVTRARTAAEAYLESLKMYDGIHDRQQEAQPRLSDAVAQMEAGLAAIRGIIRSQGLRPSRLNDIVEGLNGQESLALQVSMLRDTVGPSSREQ